MSASSLVARSAGTWKRVRVQNVFSASLRSRVHVQGSVLAPTSTLSCCRSSSSSTFRPTSTATDNGASPNWQRLDMNRHHAMSRHFSSAHASTGSSLSPDEPTDAPTAIVPGDTPERAVVVNKEDEKQEESKRRRLSDVRCM
jgi:hypothetical protein